MQSLNVNVKLLPIKAHFFFCQAGKLFACRCNNNRYTFSSFFFIFIQIYFIRCRLSAVDTVFGYNSKRPRILHIISRDYIFRAVRHNSVIPSPFWRDHRSFPMSKENVHLVNYRLSVVDGIIQLFAGLAVKRRQLGQRVCVGYLRILVVFHFFNE